MAIWGGGVRTHFNPIQLPKYCQELNLLEQNNVLDGENKTFFFVCLATALKPFVHDNRPVNKIKSHKTMDFIISSFNGSEF